jgi:RNA polymerase sigma-70 factor (ECF subfamily)
MKTCCTPDFFERVNSSEFLENLLSGGIQGKDAFQCLFRITHSRLHAYVRKHLNSTDECDEALQEIYLAIFTHLPRFQRGSKLTTWMYSVAFHKVCRQYSQREKGVITLGDDFEASYSNNHFNDSWSRLSPWDAPPNKVYARDTANSLIGKAAEDLSSVAREIYFLGDVEGIPNDKIAEKIGATKANIRLNLHRARKQIADSVRRSLKKSPYVYEDRFS